MNLRQIVNESERRTFCSQATVDTSLSWYLEIEGLLSEFAKSIGYCERCFHPPSENSQFRKDVGCCVVEGYLAFTPNYVEDNIHLLESERENLFGEPEQESSEEVINGTCGYHTINGCRLDSHKGPLCLSVLCKEQVDYLQENFEIEYDAGEWFCAIQLVLGGKVTEKEFDYMKELLGEYITIVEKN